MHAFLVTAAWCVAVAVARAALASLPPKLCDLLRRALVGDQADRDIIPSALLRFRDEAGDELADIIDTLTIHPDDGRKVVRLLAEIDASKSGRGSL